MLRFWWEIESWTIFNFKSIFLDQFLMLITNIAKRSTNKLQYSVNIAAFPSRNGLRPGLVMDTARCLYRRQQLVSRRLISRNPNLWRYLTCSCVRRWHRASQSESCVCMLLHNEPSHGSAKKLPEWGYKSTPRRRRWCILASKAYRPCTCLMMSLIANCGDFT